LGRLRQELTQRHLAPYIESLASDSMVLDAGAGTGGYAFPLAQSGHRVCLLDFSAHMLDMARAEAQRLGPPISERMTFCHAAVEQIPDLFAPGHFDVALCHTLLEYVSQPWEVVRALLGVLRPGGLLSLLCVNVHADPVRWAIGKGDLGRARQALDEQVSSADLFGLPRRTLAVETLREAVTESGGVVLAEYGIRVLADYVSAERLSDPAFYADLFALEMAAGARSPYKEIARYTLLVGRRHKEHQQSDG
jgi:S-adenosylmethionine-dependent methyltransferase